MSNYYNRQWRLPNNENKDKQSNYSMEFLTTTRIPDITGLNLGTSVDTFSISLWFNKSNMNYGIVFSTYSGSGTYPSTGVAIDLNTNGTIAFYNGANRTTTSAQYSINTWYNLVVTSDGTTVKMYVNGSQVTLDSTTVVARDFTNVWINSGKYSSSNFGITGKIDAVSIFNYALIQSQITTLYGSSSTGIGNPMSLSPKPVAFYPLGDQDVYNGANYLVPNAAVVGGYSPYALQLDGTSNYIDCGQNTNLDTGDLSASIWINKNSAGSGTQYIFNNNSGSAVAGFAFNMLASNVIGIGRRTRTYGAFSGYLNVSFTDDVWHNLSFSYNDTTKALEVWFNGNSVHTSTATSSSSVASQNIIIGDRANLTGFNFNGSLSNASIWNTALTAPQITEIYNSGVPSNLNNHSAYSNLVSWWQLGSNSSFNNTVWTVLDEKGTNDGVSSTNMSEVDIVNGVGYSSNGVSSGMSDNVIGDAPYSTANSLSVNMDVLDRTTDIPS